MKLKPHGTKILIRPISEFLGVVLEDAGGKVMKLPSGLVLPSEYIPEADTAVVEAVGDKVTLVKAGDTIVFQKRSGNHVEVDGVKYVIIDLEDVLTKEKV